MGLHGAQVGMVQNEGQLRGYLEEHIVGPLAAQAAPAPPRASPAAPIALGLADGSAVMPGDPSESDALDLHVHEHDYIL